MEKRQSPDFERSRADRALDELFENLVDGRQSIVQIQDQDLETTMLRGSHIKCEVIRWLGEDRRSDYEPVTGAYSRLVEWLADEGWEVMSLASFCFSLWTKGYGIREAADSLRGCISAPTMSFMLYGRDLENHSRGELEGMVETRYERGLPMIATNP